MYGHSPAQVASDETGGSGMEQAVIDFVQNTAHDLTGLEVALFYQANPRAFDTAAGIALRTHRSVSEVEPALERLGANGILDVFDRGDGRYHCFALSPTRETWNLLCMVSEAYHDDEQARGVIIKMLVKQLILKRTGQDFAGASEGSDADA